MEEAQNNLNEKKAQAHINDTIGLALEGLSDALKLASASRDVVMKLLQFEGNRIDTLENKIDLLMIERADAIVDRNPALFKTTTTTYTPEDEEVEPPIQLEEIHFEDYHFEVAPFDEAAKMEWDRAIKFGDHDEGWRLPTTDELRLMYLCKDRLGMRNESYWSSLEGSDRSAWIIDFDDGFTLFSNKAIGIRTRLVRTIEDE